MHAVRLALLAATALAAVTIGVLAIADIPVPEAVRLAVVAGQGAVVAWVGAHLLRTRHTARR